MHIIYTRSPYRYQTYFYRMLIIKYVQERKDFNISELAILLNSDSDSIPITIKFTTAPDLTNVI